MPIGVKWWIHLARDAANRSLVANLARDGPTLCPLQEVLLGHTVDAKSFSAIRPRKQRLPHTIETGQSRIEPTLMYVRVIGLFSRLVFCSSRLPPHDQLDMS